MTDVNNGIITIFQIFGQRQLVIVHEEPRGFATSKSLILIVINNQNRELFLMTILCLISKSSVIGNLMSFSQKIFRRGIGDPGADKGSQEGGGGGGQDRRGKLKMSLIM